MKKIVKGLYIHIPFCESKCYYCDFTSFIYDGKSRNRKINKYLDFIDMELNQYIVQDKIETKYIDTIFLGGGTPSILDVKELSKLFLILNKYLNLKSIKEFTIECNPGTITFEKLKLMKENYVNRISIGLQSTHEKHLEFMGRIHSLKDFENSYKLARKVGINNINVDLIFAFHGQTVEEWSKTLEYIANLEVEHISAYSLIIEEKTNFYKMLENGEISDFNEDLYIKMYRMLYNILKDNGYSQYEISNFSKDGMECLHNMHYWNCEEYLGIGVSSSGYINNLRYTNERNKEKYFNKLEELRKPINFEEKLSKKDIFNERIMLGLRMNKGIQIELIENSNFREKKHILDKIDRYVDSGHVEISIENCIRLTQKGREISNSIIVDLMV